MLNLDLILCFVFLIKYFLIYGGDVSIDFSVVAITSKYVNILEKS